LTNVINHKDFILALGAFLDEFRRSSNKYELIAMPPNPKVTSVDMENLCILAATAHKLANDYNITIPSWVHDPLYKMPYPVFAFHTTNKDYQEFLLQDTPPEFASKNIFHGSNAIKRA